MMFLMKQMRDNQRKLNEAGLKATSQRITLLDIFSLGTKPLTAEELLKKVSKPDFDLVTVYRTILAFEKAGIIRRVTTRQKAIRYEIASTHHHHLVCVTCHTIEDVILKKDLDKQEKIISQTKKFKILDHALEFFGTCRGCLIKK